MRVVAAIPIGWIVGYASWIPLNWSAFDEPWAQSLFWPIQENTLEQIFFFPFLYFGLVAVFYYLWLALRGLKSQSVTEHIVGGCLAGIAGSLLWWNSLELWYFSLLHGAIWGVLVGFGAGANRVKQGVA